MRLNELGHRQVVFESGDDSMFAVGDFNNANRYNWLLPCTIPKFGVYIGSNDCREMIIA